MTLRTIALFGANGQVGDSILRGLLAEDDHQFKIHAFIPKGFELQHGQSHSKVFIHEFDLETLSKDKLATELKDVDAVISALNGKALDAQPTIQDAAAAAGVARFYPSEFGMHNVYRKPDDPWGYVHPLWDSKQQSIDKAIFHPAVLEGKMTYTVVGAGDFYNQDREKVWCPWTQRDVEKYDLHIIGDPDAKADFTHLDDFGKYIVATLVNSGKSKNQFLNFTSDTISYNKIAELLEKYSGKKVNKNVMSQDEMHEIIKSPSKAPEEMTESAFPVDFWFLVKGLQGQGSFRRPPGQIHNHLFTYIKPTTFESYLKERFVREKTV
ncbi:isoflavone reductase family protein [Colletotrichum truncatum]|uniref:Isoflavone reductase family protein n=1 Tax=Colletotrichum truncatum TaxID=5467 RepID=A0ACC3ZG16_COLTU|nr:isoflavone reductase family protein [Colletotrichum truncatum]KAF6801999.1 isoflavone reductase family protein [Colletotrichum truncatum]